MVEVCAAMGLANLHHMADVVDANRRNYHTYQAALQGVSGVNLLAYDEAARNNFQYVVIEVTEDSCAGRDEIVAALQAENVLARKYFWPGCHRMKPYRALFPHAGLMLPHTERVAERVIVLPTGEDIGETDVQFIVSVIRCLA
jgi:dTDP-4-amino-4,6-dideoxygalactose transaminase